MIRGHLLQLPGWPICHTVRSGEAKKTIRLVGAKVIVEMLPPPERFGDLHLPESVSGDCRSDVGVVIAAPSEIQIVRGQALHPPRIGSLVAVWPEDGIWIEGADMGAYRPGGQIRVYGVSALAGDPVTVDWWDSIPCELMEGQLIPFGDKIVLQLDAKQDRDGSVLLPDTVQARPGMATVLRAGPLAFGINPGDRVCYSSECLLEHGLQVDGHDLAICDDRAILYVLNA